MSACRVCGRQVETSECGQPMPCVCIGERREARPLEEFLADCVADCIDGRTYSFGESSEVDAYAAGVRQDAAEVLTGRSADVDGRLVCRECGRRCRCLVDWRCHHCNEGV